MVTATVTICNKKGLHARAAAKFVKIVAEFPARVLVKKNGSNGEADSPVVSGASILGLMMLGADSGSQLCINAEGAQAQEALRALEALVADRFGEGE